jgi:multiple sugar transport system substrate-binding protein
MNKRLHPFVVGNKGSAEEALTGVANDWDKIFRKYGRIK